MRRPLTVALTALWLSLPAAAQDTQTVDLTLLSVNDLDRATAEAGRGGLAKVAGVVREEEKAGRTVLLFHAGDAISPSLLSSFDQGAHMIEGLNDLPVQAFVPGNHEFDFGAEALLARLSEATFPVVSTNVTDAEGRPLPGTVDRLLIEAEGVTFGVIGLTTTRAMMTSSPGDLVIHPPIPRARPVADALRAEGADLIIALAHLDALEDYQLVQSRVADIILTGDDHHLLTFWDGRTAMVESGAQGETVTATDLSITVATDADGSRDVSFIPSFRPIDTVAIAGDPLLSQWEGELAARLDQALGQVVGTTATALDTRRATVRGGEAAFGNLVADAMRAATGAQVALTNGGGIRADRVYPPGSALTARDLVEEMPFGNKLVVLELSGRELIAALDHGTGGLATLTGRFPQIAGMDVVIDRTAADGQRVKRLRIAGTPVDEEGRYTLVTNDFLARGGDGYTMFGEAPRQQDERMGQLMVDAVIDYLRRAGTVSPSVEGRIRLQEGN